MTHLNTPNRSTSRQAAAESGRTTFGVPIPMSITLPPARAAYRIMGESNIRVSIAYLKAAGHARANSIGWGGLRKEEGKGG